jgi:type I restriction enzyme M protein
VRAGLNPCAIVNPSITYEVQAYFAGEVLPHVPDALINGAMVRVGCVIAFNQYFHVLTPPRPVREVTAELRDLEMMFVTIVGRLCA